MEQLVINFCNIVSYGTAEKVLTVLSDFAILYPVTEGY